MFLMNNDRTIKSIGVFSTGKGEQHKEHRYGTALPKMWWALFSRSWVELPINVFVLEHRKGLELFDAGLDPRIVSDPNYINSAVGRFFLRRIFRLHVGPEDGLRNRLNALGYSASDVNKAVLSHLHFDHIGGISEIPQAELLVSNDEWKQLSTPHPEYEWILREHIELPGAKWRPIEFAPTNDPVLAPFGGTHDVMGDGSMVLLPTPGHTPGSMSMLVRDAGLSPLLMVGDLTYQRDLLMKNQVPGTGNATELRSSYAKVRKLMEQLPELVVLATHDFGAEDALRGACKAPPNE